MNIYGRFGAMLGLLVIVLFMYWRHNKFNLFSGIDFMRNPAHLRIFLLICIVSTGYGVAKNAVQILSTRSTDNPPDFAESLFFFCLVDGIFFAIFGIGMVVDRLKAMVERKQP